VPTQSAEKALKISANSIVLICIKGRKKCYKYFNDLHLMPNREHKFFYCGFASKEETFCYKPFKNLHQMQKNCILENINFATNHSMKLHQKEKKSATNLPIICTTQRKC
jgi:hypothetical protein